MVNKLLKYESAYYTRTMLPMYLVLLAVAVFTRIIQFFESEHTAYSIVFISSVVALVVASLVCLVMAFIVSITRFYRNMFTAEGYLTLTLPVTPNQHIFAKVFSAWLCGIVSAIAVILSAMIATEWDVIKEIFRSIGYLIGKLFDTEYAGGFVLLGSECLVSILLGLAVGLLLVYTCIAIGQRAKKSRILAAFGVYLAFYFAKQFLGTAFIILASVCSEIRPGWYVALSELFARHPLGFVNSALGIGLVVSAAFGVLCWFIVNRTLKKHLNVE